MRKQLVSDGWKLSDSFDTLFISAEHVNRFDDAWLRTSVGDLLKLLHDHIDREVSNDDGGHPLGRHVGDERDLYSDNEGRTSVQQVLLQMPEKLRALYLCSSSHYGRRLDQVYLVIKTSADAQSIYDEMLHRIKSGSLENEMGGTVTAVQMDVAERTARKLTIMIRNKSDRNRLRAKVSDEIAKALETKHGKHTAQTTMCLVHRTASKLPPKQPSDLIPKLWIRHHDSAASGAGIASSTHWSKFINEFGELVGGPYLRITLVGLGLRLRLGRMKDKQRAVIREAVNRAICQFICEECRGISVITTSG